MSWRQSKLTDVAEIVSGATPRTSNSDYWDGDILWITPSDLSDYQEKYIDKTSRMITREGLDSCSASMLPENSVILSSRAPIGYVVINSKPMATNQGFKSIIPQKDILDPEFLFYWLRSKNQYLNDLGRGATFKEISKSIVESLIIPLPPLDDQKRIAAILDQADALRRKRAQALSRLDDLMQSVFLDMFGDPVMNSKAWDVHCVETFCDIVRGSSPRPSGDPRYFGGEVPRLMVADMTRDGYYVTPIIDSLTKEGAEKSRPMKKGSVVMAVSGNVGIVSILNVDACIHDGIVGFRELNTDIILHEYLLFVLGFLKRTYETKQDGAIFKNLTTRIVKDIEVPVPPMDVQEKWQSFFHASLEQREKLLLSSKKLDELFNALQQAAFSGQLLFSESA